MQPALTALANRLAAHLNARGLLDEPLRCAEIGARKSGTRLRGEPFYDLDRKMILAFEADLAEAERLTGALGSGSPAHIVGAAVGGQEGEADLYITRSPKCSSLYRPNEELIARYPGLAVASTDRVAKVRLTTLPAALSAVGWRDIHLLKMDIQGAELDVIRAAGTALDGVVTLITEVSFQPIYEDQPLAEDVFSGLRAKGFELYRLLTQGGMARRTCRRDQMQVLWGDALFIRPPEVLAASGAARLSVLATLYGALDVAECALERVGPSERAWFVAQIQQPWRNRIDDVRTRLRRLRRGVMRRMRMP